MRLSALIPLSAVVLFTAGCSRCSSGPSGAESTPPNAGSREAEAVPPLDWQAKMVGRFLTKADLPKSGEAIKPEILDPLVALSPVFQVDAPGSGFADVQKGNCLVAAFLQQAPDQLPGGYSLGGSLAVGACTVETAAGTVRIKAGTMKFYRALSCPGSGLETLVREKNEPWFKLRQSEPFASCGGAPRAYLTEQVAADLVVYDDASKEKTRKVHYDSGLIGTDEGPCVGIVAESVVHFKDCVDFEHLHTERANEEPDDDWIKARYDDISVSVAHAGAGMTGSMTVAAGDWAGKATFPAAKGQATVKLKRQDATTEIVIGAPSLAKDPNGPIRSMLRAIRRGLKADLPGEQASAIGEGGPGK